MGKIVGYIKKADIRVILCYLVFLCLMTAAVSFKEGYHTDEVYTYGLANGEGHFTPRFTEGEPWNPSDVFAEFMNVHRGGQFQYRWVWENQADDVHPPFYYLLVHTVCSFFPDTFSNWYAAGINIVFALMVLALLRRYAVLYVQDEEMEHIITLFWIFNAGVISAVTLFRMYIVAMFFVTCISYLISKALITGDFDRRFYLGAFIVTVLGGLTHYYYIVYLFFISVGMGACLLWQKRFRQAGYYVLTMAASGCVCVAVFPAMLQHMFGGYRSVESMENLKNLSIREYYQNLSSIYTIVNTQLFGGMLHYVLLFLAFAAMLWFLRGKTASQRLLALKEKLRCADGRLQSFCVTAFAVCAYFLIVVKMAVFVSDRYYMPVYAVASLLFLLGVRRLLLKWFHGHMKGLMVLVSVAVIAGSWNLCTWTYLYRNMPELEVAAEYSGADVLFIYHEEEQSTFDGNFAELLHYHSVTCYQDSHLDELQNYAGDKWKLLYISKDCDADMVRDAVLALPEYSNSDKLSKTRSGNIYNLY